MNKSRYAAGPEVYLEIVRDLSYEYVQMLIIGHNAGLEELVEMLTVKSTSL
jgi:phosphohistidine phosphatase SixA